MQLLADKVWVLATLVAGIGLLGLLHVMAIGIQNQVKVHDLKIRVNTLRQQQMDRLRERMENQQGMFAQRSASAMPPAADDEIIEVDEVPQPVERRKAA
ncbi:MAG TPA: hypothetical protein VHN77_07775 [Phycisphaerales bacterium]|nr:hypothetical protein [Phycisphaerales bacterium]